MKMKMVLPGDHDLPPGYILHKGPKIVRKVDGAIVDVEYESVCISDSHYPSYLEFISDFDEAWRLQGMRYYVATSN